MRRGLLMLALPLALAACGGHSYVVAPMLHVDPVAYVKHAAIKTAQAPTEHMTMTGTGSKGVQTITIKGSGDADNRHHLIEMHANASAARLGMQLDLIEAGQTIYLSSPLFVGQIPGGKTWAKIDIGKALAKVGVPSALSTSPSRILQLFRHVVHVTDVGSETIDGMATTHYRVRIDLTKPLARKFSGMRLRETEDLWVGNSDGYVHRLQITEGSLAMTMDFSKFGEPVHITVPSASETYDATDKAIQGLRG